MRKSVVPDFVAFTVDPLRQVRILVRLDPNEEETGGSMFPLQHVKNFRSPLRIGPVVEGDSNLLWRGTVPGEPIRFGQGLEGSGQ